MAGFERYDDHESDSVKDWVLQDARLVTGSDTANGRVLIGPYEDGGVQGIFPPGVYSLYPNSEAQPMTNQGWRHSIWETSYKERPVHMKQLGLKEAAQLVERIAPEHINFIKACVARNIRIATGTLRQDAAGVYESEQGQSEAVDDILSLRAEAAQAWPDEPWNVDSLIPCDDGSFKTLAEIEGDFHSWDRPENL